MKKALALVMALAMVMSMAAVSFAAVTNVVLPKDDDADDTIGALTGFDEDTYVLDDKALGEKDQFPYGETVYLIPLTGEEGSEETVKESKTISNLSIKTEWEEGGKYVESVEFVKKKASSDYDSTAAYVYLLAIETTGSETSTKDVIGTINLKGKSGDDKVKIDGHVDVAFTLGYDAYNLGDEIGEDKVLYKEAGDGTNEREFVFGDKFVVTVDMKKDNKVVLAYDDDVIDEIDEAYPNANIDYYALTGSFKKTAEVVVDLEDGEEFLYQVVNGKVVEVNGEYDDWSEEFTFKTKTLGTYIISDAKLTTAAVAVTNPTTGAAA